MTRVVRTALAVGVVVMVGLLGLSPASADPATEAAPAAEPEAVRAITVSPSTALVSGATVSVHGTGFPVGQTGIVQCAADVASAADCDLSTTSYVETREDGTFDAVQIVRRTIRLGASTIHCSDAPDTCAIAAGNIADQSQGARQTISFDPTVPLPSPSVTVTPDSDLVDGQSVGVTGSGFRNNSLLLIQLCATGEVSCTVASGPVLVGVTGLFSTNFTVRNRTSTAAGTVSCLVVTCELRVADTADHDYEVSVPLAFDPSSPPPLVPTVTATPSEDLVDRQVVTVSGTDFAPGRFVFVSQCTAARDACAQLESGFAPTTPTGSFSFPVRVRRIIGRYGPGGIEPVDCALETCVLAADQDDTSGLRATTAITFDPAVPPAPPPTITAAPTTGLAYRASVTVTGEGFVPAEYVTIDECGTSTEGIGACTGGIVAVVDETGAITATVPVRRLLRNPDEPTLDCAAAPGTCELQVYSSVMLEPILVPLAFDPDAPIPPPPTISVDPSTGLGYRQPVTLHATGFAPEDSLSISQCLADPDDEQFLSPCSGFEPATADATGDVDMPFTVRRTLSNGFDEPIDCSSAPGTCVVLIASDNGGDFASTPLSFDPNAPIPPPPSLTVTPATGLSDGQTVQVAGSGFTPSAPIGFTLCGEGALSLNRCAIEQAVFATADANGSFTGSLPVRSSIATAEGDIDCGAAPGTCAVAAANTSDFIENGRAPISFGPEISISAADVTVRFGTARLGVVTVGLSAPSTREVRVHWTTEDGTARAGSDYLEGEGDLVFAPGETSKTILLGIFADGTRTQTEQFDVVLSAPQAGNVGADGGRASLTIPSDARDGHHHGHHHHHWSHDHGHHHGHHHHHGWSHARDRCRRF